jgi:hypothetical protein
MLDWQTQLKGAFAFQAAPFAVHPNDERRAIAAISNAIRSGASKADIELEIREYLTTHCCTQEFILYQISLFRSFFRRQYAQVKNCWILSRPNPDTNEFIAIFSGRKSLDDILWHCMHIYQIREFNQATQFMRARKKRWPNFQIKFHEFDGGALWEGRTYVGENPAYILEKADATLSNGLDPTSSIVWKPKPIPCDPGSTWHGLRYRG